MSGAENREHHEPYLEDLVRHSPRNWEDPAVKTTLTAMLQPGILPSMIRRNPELLPRITDFLIGDKPILITGGESGMGKSLIVTDLRILHKNLMPFLPKRLRTKLAVITWDRIHQIFYDHVSLEAGYTVELPEGETPLIARNIVSSSFEDGVRYSQKYVGPNTRVLIEAPLINHRGESLLEDIKEQSANAQLLVMFSPACRDEILTRGRRVSKTSGQFQSMVEIRGGLIDKIAKGSPSDDWDDLIKRWWNQTILRDTDGMVVEWDPNDDRAGYEFTVEKFRAFQMPTDPLVPDPMGWFYRGQFDAVFRAMSGHSKGRLLRQLKA